MVLYDEYIVKICFSSRAHLDTCIVSSYSYFRGVECKKQPCDTLWPYGYNPVIFDTFFLVPIRWRKYYDVRCFRPFFIGRSRIGTYYGLRV